MKQESKLRIRRIYGHLFVRKDGELCEIHPDGSPVSRSEIEQRASEGIKCFDKFIIEK